MATSNLRKRILASGSAMQALALLGAGLTASAVMVAPAHAQDYTSAAISGTVTGESGTPVAGATVTLTSTDTGTVRTATTSSTGSYRFAGLQPGSYDLEISAQGLSPYQAQGIKILAGQTANVPVALNSSSNVIVVSGTRAVQAFTGTTTGLNVDVSDFISDKPLGRSLQSVILLAPGVVAGNSSNSTFNGLSSLGGSSVAENAYYVNGLNVTNFDDYLGGATVPFYFYKSIDTKTGGYPAEYGRATGGIVNAVTKSGTNEFTAAVHVDWAPNFLTNHGKNLTNTAYVDPNDPSKGTTTYRLRNRAFDTSDSLVTTIEAGGPIIKDRLFFYGLLQMQNKESLVNYPAAQVAYKYKNTDPFWGVKLDAYPIDSQHLELTLFDTRNTQTRSDFSLTENAGVPTYGSATAINNFPGGGLNYVGKYTGTFTDWLTVSAAYGRVRDRFDVIPVSGNFGTPYFYNDSGSALYGVPYGGKFTNQALVGIDQPYTTERKFFRADVDLRFSLLGEHHVRGGFDQEINTLNHVTVLTGGDVEYANGFLSQAAHDAFLGGAGFRMYARAPDANGNIVELNYYNTGGSFKAKNKAFYLEDEWKPTDRLTINLGVRRDDFRINKPSGLPLADLPKNYAPRIGFSYDVGADSSGTFYGSYGWYYLPIASNTAYRQGAPSYYFRQRYYFNGVDSNGLPILVDPTTGKAPATLADALVTNDGTYQSACPLPLLPSGPTTNCNVTGNGADIDLSQGIAANLKATRESEIILGYKQRFGLWKLGISYTHRNLDRTAEDSAIDAGVIAWCNANGIVAHANGSGAAIPCSDIWTGYNQYVINNPGNDIVVSLLAPGTDLNFKQITLKAADLGYGKAKRTYDAVTLTFDKEKGDSIWTFGGSYTWSKSLGNSEGFVQSDFGQTDAGITQDFDQPGFVAYSYGYLPNDRRHKIKLYGTVDLSKNFTIGTNLQIVSPAHLSCFGYNPTDVFANGYRQASHYCNLQPAPRGQGNQSDWFTQLDLSLRYKTEIAGRGLTLRADVFNVLNSQAVLGRNQIGDLSVNSYNSAGLPVSVKANPAYGQPILYQTPRYVRLGADISF
ncbi:TonB-dependent receptor [Tsuneonella mangrovi]|uniref:TonB-dependent receptor n=1 Tax=Tsuneonella mangrovi TaxID=1982042 RepID=UPI001471B9B1|nr:TonB-dependent receptor [Tsuneonella mangrovi]